MRFSLLAYGLAAISQLTQASPLVRRADASEAATMGYASTNGGTTGGAGGSSITVSNLADLQTALSGDDPAIIILSGSISGASQIRIGSNKTLLGKNSSAKLTGVGLLIKGAKNVIVRNLSISKVAEGNGDAIGIDSSNNVWIDHCDLSSDMDHGKDFYDGLLDITHAADFVTVSNTFMHDHYKASLVGHSDSNAAEDRGTLHVTYANNYWRNINSRGPSFRFGTGHVYNNFYENVSDGINTRQSAELLVENNVFDGAKKPLYAADGGRAVAKGNDFGGAENTAPEGSLTTLPYDYSLVEVGSVKGSVIGTAGATLVF
jgi:pectate lyase